MIKQTSMGREVDIAYPRRGSFTYWYTISHATTFQSFHRIAHPHTAVTVVLALAPLLAVVFRSRWHFTWKRCLSPRNRKTINVVSPPRILFLPADPRSLPSSQRHDVPGKSSLTHVLRFVPSSPGTKIQRAKSQSPFPHTHTHTHTLYVAVLAVLQLDRIHSCFFFSSFFLSLVRPRSGRVSSLPLFPSFGETRNSLSLCRCNAFRRGIQQRGVILRWRRAAAENVT